MRRSFAGERNRRYHRRVPSRDLSCRELTDFIYAYEEGELPAGEHAAFEAHLAECLDCKTYLAGYRRSVSLGKRAFEQADDSLPDDIPDDLVRAVLAARRHQRPG